MKKRSGFTVMARLIRLVKPLSGYMVLAILMGLVGHLCAAFITIFGGFAVLDLLGFATPVVLKTTFICVLLFALVRGIFRYAEQSCNHFIAFKLLALIRDKVFRALRRLCPAKLEGRDRGDLISVITSDIELLEVFYAHTISPAAIAALFTLIMCLFIGHYHALLGLLALAAYVCVGVVIPLITSHRSCDTGMRFRTESGALSAFVLDSLRGLNETIQYDRGAERRAEMDARTDALSKEEAKLKRLTGQNMGITNTAILLFDLAMLVSSAALVQRGELTFDGALIAVLALFSSFGPTVALANLGATLQNTFAAGNRVLDILDEEPVVDEVTGQKEVEFTGAEAEHVTFSYGGEDILSDVSVRFPEGSVVGIVGRSGSGKSTLLKLLMRFWDVQKGRVRLSGTDVSSINTGNLREMESFVTQETHLFHDSIKNNLRIAKLDATDDEIVAACKKAAVHEFIMTLPQGYDTSVGELGDTLSGGERQRLGLARAFLHDAPLMLLDEPTSNLDMQAIMDLRSYVATAKAAGASVLVAEHRLWWLAGIADEIVVMGDGRVTKRLSAQEFASLSAREVRELGLRVRSLNDVAASARVTADSQTRSESAPRADGRPGAGEVFQAETGLDVRDARAGYRKHEVLRGVDLSVRAGEVVALVGRNGAGKSTLSRAICGLAKGSGAFRLFGKEVNERERLARSSMVFQDVNYQLFAESAASEVVFGLPKDRARSVDVEGILSSLGLRDVSGRHPATLSGGQKQRLAVASCVAAGKDVLVFDEPTSGLDLESMRRVASLIRRLADEGRVVLVVTHDLEFIACACDRAVELSEGVVAGSYDVAGGVGAIRRALFVDSQCDD